jgi:hypothetical protein
MIKKITIGVAALFLLTGCVADTPSSQPAPTVTVTERAEGSGGSASSSSNNVRDDFVMYMQAGGVASWMLKGDALEVLIDQARNTCRYIDDGDSQEDIIWMITMAQMSSNADQEIVDAIIAASVAATYTYCPQHRGFWG